jgi:hypothetical protein
MIIINDDRGKEERRRGITDDDVGMVQPCNLESSTTVVASVMIASTVAIQVVAIIVIISVKHDYISLWL